MMKFSRRWGVRILFAVLGLTVIFVTFGIFVYVFYKGSDVISLKFLLEKPSGLPIGTDGGVFPAIIGSLYHGLLAGLFGSLIGIGAALYLVFFCRSAILKKIVQVSFYFLAGLPSIIFGLIGYTVLIFRFGLERSLLCASVATGMMLIPYVGIRAQKIFQEEGLPYLMESQSLGISKAYAVRKLILPVCFVNLLSASALAMAYGMGAVAPMMYTGAVLYAGVPEGLDRPFMSLPYHLYILVINGISVEFAYGTAFVLLVLILLIHFAVRGTAFFREGGEWRWRRLRNKR